MIDSYRNHLPTSGMRDKSIREVNMSLKHFERFVNGQDIDRQRISEFRDWVGAQDWSPNYRNLVLAHVKAMLRWSMDRDVCDIPENKIRRCLKSFKVNRESPVVLTREQLDNLGAGCIKYPKTGRTVLAVLMTGARHREILDMTDADVTEHGVEIGAERSKNRQGRVIPWTVLGPRVRELFDPLPFVWDRQEWDAIRQMTNKPKMKVKSLRSTAATYWISQGSLPPRTCTALMGHTVAVAEKSYWGAPVLGIDGDYTDEWMGLRKATDYVHRALNGIATIGSS